MKMKVYSIFILTLSLIVFSVGCAYKHKQSAKDQYPTVQFKLEPKSGSQVSGQATVVQKKDGVQISVKLDGLLPNTVHGFHIHENGDCSSPDATSAGGHFNSDHHPHGGPKNPLRHAGDLGNITSNDKGKATVSLFVKGLNLYNDNKYSILDRALVIHAAADDFTSQPSGAAGQRIVCGVIK